MNKEAKVLLLNDIHVSKETIDDFKLNWKEAVDIAIYSGITNILIGGDLFTSRHSQTLDVLLAVYNAFQECMDNNIKVFIANGNHDKVDQERNEGYAHVFKSFDNVVVVDDWFVIELSYEVRIAMIAYFPENGSFISKLEELEQSEELRWSEINILYIHQGIRGALSQPSEDELPASIFDNWSKVLVGHYHNRCKIKDTNIEYIGSSRQHNFGEDEEKGYTIIYSDGSIEFVKNQINKRFVTLDVQYAQINTDEFVKMVQKYKDSGYKIRLNILCNQTQVKNINKASLFDLGITKIEVDVPVDNVKMSSQKALNERYDKNGLIDSYRNFCNDNEVQNVDFGIQYLNKIDVCGN